MLNVPYYLSKTGDSQSRLIEIIISITDIKMSLITYSWQIDPRLDQSSKLINTVEYEVKRAGETTFFFELTVI